MQFITADNINDVLSPELLIDSLRAIFCSPAVVPPRHHHTIRRKNEERATLLLMPAWEAQTPDLGGADEESFIGVKIASIFPLNAQRHTQTVQGTYLLMSGMTGRVLAIMDGVSLTYWRTAAASALAASYLALPQATHMVMVGAGALAPYLIRAHAAARPIKDVKIWNRHPEKALQLAKTLSAELEQRDIRIEATSDLCSAIAKADIVSAATLATAPLIKGDWLRPGTHVDLVGGFTPLMREADNTTLRRAKVYVDTLPSAVHEAGDIVQAIAEGIIRERDLRGELSDLCRGTCEGRSSHEEITLFKSVGTALEDLAAAALVYSRLQSPGN